MRAFLWTIENSARVRYGRPFSRLPEATRRKWLRHFAEARYPVRILFRTLGIFVKLGYYDNPQRFAALGREYEKPPVVDEPQRWWELVTPGSSITEDLELECDAVVVGTGAGGAVVAAELAERGHAVVMIEQGEYHRRSAFTGRPIDMQKLMYEDRGLTVTLGNVGIVMPYGRCVGGTTTINSGTCFRTPPRVLAEWRERYGLSEYDEASLEPYFQRVESEYRVTPADMKYVGKSGEIIARGAEKLGFEHGPLPRNAPDCDGQGCCALGCPADAKRSTNVSYVPRALQANAFLITGTEVDEITLRDGQACGVSGHVAATGRRVRIKSRVTVLAGGAISTPLLLLQTGLANSSGQVGRNLSIHPSAGVFAINKEELEPEKSIPQGYGVFEFADQDLLLENAHFPLDMAGMFWSQIGPDLQQLQENYNHLSVFGFIIRDTSRGRVRPGHLQRALITYDVNPTDLRGLLHGISTATRIMLASGARAVHGPVHGWRLMRSERDLAANLRRPIRVDDLDLSAYHPLGTCHMGGDARSSVCRPDGRAWDVPGLYIADGSVVPPALGVNPMITISAVAARIADCIHDGLHGGGS
ncbi:MAG: GMC family oxidoreductase [Candidatus Lernaella stagnicola]|nr:GMC family oxidoreductase [Candidatus Lernaella stagnicola]